MELNLILKTILERFDEIKESDEKLGFISEKQIVYLSSDETIKNKSYKEARLVRSGVRKKIIMASGKGQMLCIKPVLYKSSIISAYIFFAKPDRIEILDSLIDKIIFITASRVDKVDQSTIILDLDAIHKPIDIEKPKKENNTKNKKIFTKKMLQDLIVEKDYDYIRAWLFISPFYKDAKFLDDLKDVFTKYEHMLTQKGMMVFSKDKPSSTINTFIDKYNCKTMMSYRFDPSEKEKMFLSLISLDYIPNPVITNNIIHFEENEDQASIVLSYLNNPYQYYEELKSLHSLEKNKNLYASFITYVETEFNFNKTCEVLKVHRNTIYNRIKKIAETFKRKNNTSGTYYHLYSLYILFRAIKDKFLPDITIENKINF